MNNNNAIDLSNKENAIVFANSLLSVFPEINNEVKTGLRTFIYELISCIQSSRNVKPKRCCHIAMDIIQTEGYLSNENLLSKYSAPDLKYLAPYAAVCFSHYLCDINPFFNDKKDAISPSNSAVPNNMLFTGPVYTEVFFSDKTEEGVYF